MKTIFVRSLATLACVALFAGVAGAEQQQYRYSCRAGAITISSKTPCYVTTYGISVPGGGGAIDKGGKEGGQQGGGSGGKKGGGFNGPKDLKDKPKGGGLNGPKDIKDKD
jgi:hypothetical protein